MSVADTLIAAIDNGVRAGVKSAIKQAGPSIADMVIDALVAHPAFPFRCGMVAAFCDAGMQSKEAWDLSGRVMNLFLTDEKIGFGAPGWDWSPAGGKTVAIEYEISNWEQPA